MKPIYKILVLASLANHTNCNSINKNPASIRDFDKTLQPYLFEIVSKGIVDYDTAARYIQKNATDKDLKQLSISEHPVLRALAFREILERPTFNHFEIMMNNLDDTSIVAVDDGEWGIRFRRVSDDMLQNGKWKDTAAKKKTVEEIILKHNSLSSAYYKVLDLETQEIYYPYIKQMAQRERNFCDDFEQLEYALSALAAYKKPDDIPLIKQLLVSNISRISGTSFGLMKEYPNETYLEIYEKFYPRSFYREICQGQNFNTAISFINSIATYKNERSERILSSILSRKPFTPCLTDTSTLKSELIYAIWNNPCNAYTKIRGQIKRFVKNKEPEKETDISIPPLVLDTTLFIKPKSAEPVSWW